MYTSGSINGSNKSSIHLPLDRMAAFPASTHSSLNAKLLLRDLSPAFTPQFLNRIGQCQYEQEPCLKNTKAEMSALLLGLWAEALLVRAAGRLAEMCKNQYRASAHCFMELLIKRDAWQASLTKGKNVLGFHGSTAPSRFWLSVRTLLTSLLIVLLGQASCGHQVENRFPCRPLFSYSLSLPTEVLSLVNPAKTFLSLFTLGLM